MGSDIITIRGGDRNLWIDFIAKCKKDKKTAWEVLSVFIKDHLK